MPSYALDPLIASIIFFIASVPMGAFAYGFSSISAPLLLLWYTNKQVVPVLNLIEVFQNTAMIIMNRRGLTKRVLFQILPFASGVVPGIFLGVYILNYGDPQFLKLMTYSVLTPLVLLQAAGIRRPLGATWLPMTGIAVGTLYGSTTISGPLIALVLNNNGLVKDEFRAGMSVVRVIESYFTATLYLIHGYFTLGVVYTAAITSLPIILGIALGRWIVAHVRPELFRRLVMSFDAWVVGYGLSNTAAQLKIIPATWAPLLFLAVALTDSLLFVLYLRGRLQPRVFGIHA